MNCLADTEGVFKVTRLSKNTKNKPIINTFFFKMKSSPFFLIRVLLYHNFQNGKYFILKKKVLIIGLFFVFLLSLVTLNTPSVSAKQFKYPNGKNAQIGDVLVTSDAFANGFVGHTGTSLILQRSGCTDLLYNIKHPAAHDFCFHLFFFSLLQ